MIDVVMKTAGDFEKNIERFTGFAGLYDRTRAGPPAVLAEILAHYSGNIRPKLVVDLGSGTGLSTRYWAERADRVIGIEPTNDMRHQATAATDAKNISYREGFSHDTRLPTRCAQVVTCVQSLHWMEPNATFAEVARILAPGGIFAACDYNWPPTTASWEADDAFQKCMLAGRRLEQELKLDTPLLFWEKSGHLARMQESGQFRFVKEVLVHHIDSGNAKRFVGLLLSQGYIATLQKAGFTEQALGVDEFRAVAQQTLGDVPRPFIWSARLRLGVV